MALGSGEWKAIRNGLLGIAAGCVASLVIMGDGLAGRGTLVGALCVVSLLIALLAHIRTRGLYAIRLRPADAAQDDMLPRLAREVLSQLPDPLMLLDLSGRVIFSNSAMAAVVGMDAVNKHVSAVWRTPPVLQGVERTVESGEPSVVEFSTPVPVARYYQAYATRIAHAPYLTALLLHDVTAVKRAEQARADFIANASHELRTPLAAVSGFIDTLKGHARDDETARERFLDIMSVEAARMRRLIDDLLSLTRIELNEHVPPSEETDLVGVVRDTVSTLQGLAKAENVSVEIAATDALPPVVGQRDELMQLFQNLVHNAIKYGRPNGHVWIGFSHTPAVGSLPARGGSAAQVSVTVRDDGEGIPREAIPRLTERFYRVDVKRSRERGGTGLGLAIVKHIVNRHGGRLQIESRQGEGSTFTVTLPARA